MIKNKPAKPEPQRFASVQIRSEPDIAITVQCGKKLAAEIGFDSIEQTYAATSISELATNLLFHAIGGRIMMRTLFSSGRWGLEVISQDEGPGIEDITMVLKDGYSTNSKSIGYGLGGVQRMMDEFEIESTLGKGTKITARIWEKKENVR